MRRASVAKAQARVAAYAAKPSGPDGPRPALEGPNKKLRARRLRAQTKNTPERATPPDAEPLTTLCYSQAFTPVSSGRVGYEMACLSRRRSGGASWSRSAGRTAMRSGRRWTAGWTRASSSNASPARASPRNSSPRPRKSAAA